MTDDLENRFNYHSPADAPDPDVRAAVHATARSAMKDAAKAIDYLCPDGREKSLAITKLEEAMFWANAAIARSVE